MSLSAHQRAAIVAEAMTWRGTPYHHRARVRGAGVDCAQLLVAVYAAVGLVPLVDTGEYPQDWALHRSDERFLGWLREYARPVACAQPGDVLVMRYGRCYSHGAIVVDDRLLIHSFLGRGVEVVERAEFADRGTLAFEVRNVRA
jgi:cell wall-associated NlpC family hydrolase